jgi:transposase
MLDALLAGERDPAVLAGLAKGRLRVKHSALVEAFEGVRFGSQHALLIGGIVRHIDFLDAESAVLGDAIAKHLAADREQDDRPAPQDRDRRDQARDRYHPTSAT